MPDIVITRGTGSMLAQKKAENCVYFCRSRLGGDGVGSTKEADERCMRNIQKEEYLGVDC